METILIVEDDPAMLRGLKDNFEFKGYRVLTAADGEAGLNAALDKKPDLIILDIMMPQMSGMEVLERLKERAETSHIPVIMCTAKVQDSDLLDGYRSGADYYLTKPFTAQQLLYGVGLLLGDQEPAHS